MTMMVCVMVLIMTAWLSHGTYRCVMIVTGWIMLLCGTVMRLVAVS